MEKSQEWKKLLFTGKYLYDNNPLSSTLLSTIYRAKDVETGEIVILKEMKLSQQKQRKLEVQREVELTSKAQASGNKYLVHLLDSKVERGSAYLFLQYYTDSDLGKYLEKKPGKKLNEDHALSLFAKICEGYNWLAMNDIVHRDLKPANIFMDGDNPVIGDFGKCREYDSKMSQSGFTITYMAPEQIWGNENYGRGVDIWALGVILYEIVYGKHPFVDGNQKVEENIVKKDPTFSEDLPRINKILKRMLEKDQYKRITWSQLYGHMLSISSPPRLLDEITCLIDSAKFYSLAITILDKCQILKDKKSKKLFIPHEEFFFLNFCFVGIALSKVNIAIQHAADYKSSTGKEITPEMTNELKIIKENLEKISKEKGLITKMEEFRSVWEKKDEKKDILSSLMRGEDPIDIEHILKTKFCSLVEPVLASVAESECELGDYQQLAFQVLNSMHDLLNDGSEARRFKKNVQLIGRISEFNGLLL